MYLPHQLEPVDRTATESKWIDTNPIEPQIECHCLQQGATGPYHWWCIIGRQLWDSGYECEP